MGLDRLAHGTGHGHRNQVTRCGGGQRLRGALAAVGNRNGANHGAGHGTAHTGLNCGGHGIGVQGLLETGGCHQNVLREMRNHDGFAFCGE